MTQLREVLTSPERKPAVVNDLAVLVDTEVSNLGGLTGIAAKAAYAGARNRVPGAISANLPQIADVVQPYWDSFQAAGASDFGAHLAENSDAVVSSVIGVVDSEVAASGTAAGMYGRFKPQLVKILTGALPRLGAIVQSHAS